MWNWWSLRYNRCHDCRNTYKHTRCYSNCSMRWHHSHHKDRFIVFARRRQHDPDLIHGSFGPPESWIMIRWTILQGSPMCPTHRQTTLHCSNRPQLCYMWSSLKADTVSLDTMHLLVYFTFTQHLCQSITQMVKFRISNINNHNKWAK